MIPDISNLSGNGSDCPVFRRPRQSKKAIQMRIEVRLQA